MNHGFVKVAAAIPRVEIADCLFNVKQIEGLMMQAEEQRVQIVVFPELSITGYSCADLLPQPFLLDSAEQALSKLLHGTRRLNVVAILGMAVSVGGVLYNSAVIIRRGEILGVVPKTYLPNYREFYEKRWFAPAASLTEKQVNLCGRIVPIGTNLLFDMPGVTFGIEICEDLWATVPPSSFLALQGADIIFNLSADNEGIGKHNYLSSLISQQSARCLAGYVFASSGFGESTTDVVFAGNGLIFENGTLLNRSRRFSLEEQLVVSEIDVEYLRTERRINTTYAAGKVELQMVEPFRIEIEDEVREIEITRTIDPHPFVPAGSELNEHCKEIFSIQTMALAKRIVHTRAQNVVIGISGGLDSTLALLVCVKTFDILNLSRKGIIGITMPGFGTTDRTYNNALDLMRELGVTLREISIKDACLQHFKDIGQDVNVHDVTYENGQARERTQILMDVANQVNGMVIGTGDLSELALGWATYNGDHMSMYGVNAGIAKTLVRHLVEWVANNEMDDATRSTLLDIADTPISPELIPAHEDGAIKQKTEDLVGPYELHDFFLYNFQRFGFGPNKILFLAQKAFAGKYEDETIRKWMHTFFRRFFSQQFKRSCMPDGPKVGVVSLSPRGDWRMPSDASAAAWLRQIEQ